MSHDGNTDTPADGVEAFASTLPGRTVHCLRGSRYAGVYNVAEVLQVVDGWIQFKTAPEHGRGGCITSARPEDVFDTETEARDAATARRAPRRPRNPQALYGDLRWVAAVNHITTDGTGRYVPPGDR